MRAEREVAWWAGQGRCTRASDRRLPGPRHARRQWGSPDATRPCGCASRTRHRSGQLDHPADHRLRDRDRLGAGHDVPATPSLAGSGFTLVAELLRRPRVHDRAHRHRLLGDRAWASSRAESEAVRSAGAARPWAGARIHRCAAGARAACELPVAAGARGGRVLRARRCLDRDQTQPSGCKGDGRG